MNRLFMNCSMACRRLFLVFAACTFPHSSKAQTTVVSDGYLVSSRSESYHWSINGIHFKPSKDKTVIYPHKQGWDTIIFWDNEHKKKPDTIISSIPKGQDYCMSIGCCDAGFELYRIDTAAPKIHYDSLSMEQMDSIYFASFEFGMVKFVIKNQKPGDSIFCLYTDFAGMPTAQVISTDKLYDWVPPATGYYSSNNAYVVIARKKKPMTLYYEENNLVSWDSPEFDSLFSTLKEFRLRLFNHEKVIVEYDCKTGTIKLLLSH